MRISLTYPVVSADTSPGDKETYWLAAELTSTPYHFLPEYAGTIGALSEDNATICGLHLAHVDSQRKLLWVNGSARKNKKAMGTPELADFSHWMIGGTDYPAPPSWTVDEPVWCATGVPPIAINGSEIESTVKGVMREVSSVDQDFGFI